MAEASTQQSSRNPGKPNRHRRLRIISQIDHDLILVLAGYGYRWMKKLTGLIDPQLPHVCTCTYMYVQHHDHHVNSRESRTEGSYRRNTQPDFSFLSFWPLSCDFRQLVGMSSLPAYEQVLPPHHKLACLLEMSFSPWYALCNYASHAKKGHHPSRKGNNPCFIRVFAQELGKLTG